MSGALSRRGFLALMAPVPALGLGSRLGVGVALARAAPGHAAIAARALEGHILPGFAALAAEAAALARAGEGCAADAGALRAALARTFDAWVRVDFLRFGPAEEEGRGFAVQFWPDDRGAGPRSLRAMIAAEDPVVDDPAAFASLSVAARGLMALDWLLHDPGEPPPSGYRCRLAAAIARDLAATAATLAARWRDPWAGWLSAPGAAGNPVYLTPDEVTQDLQTALLGGFGAALDLRLGRPLGSFDAPRPKRAEAWRSGRSLANLAAALEGMHAFARAAFWPEIGPDARARLDAGAARVLAIIARQPEPLDVAVATPQGRVRIEAIRSALELLRDDLAATLGPALGVSAGFNAMDGD